MKQVFQVAPSFPRPHSSIRLAKFKCCFGGDPTPQIVWSHNECRISDLLTVPGSTSSSARYRTHKLHDIHYLDIGPINENDQGEIRCVINNRYGREEMLVQLLVVRKWHRSRVCLRFESPPPPPRVDLATPAEGVPSITLPLNDVTINEGQPLNVSCSINGLQATVSWFHNGKVNALHSRSSLLSNDVSVDSVAERGEEQLQERQGHFSSFSGNNSCLKQMKLDLVVQCTMSDAGTLDCLVKNRFGEARTSCHIAMFDR